MTTVLDRYDTTGRRDGARVAFPPKLSVVQLGPTAKPGVCAFAPERGCGLLVAHFYIGGWRCGKHGPAAIPNSPTTTGTER